MEKAIVVRIDKRRHQIFPRLCDKLIPTARSRDDLVLQADGVEVPDCSARILPMDLKSRGVKKPDWALASLGIMAELGEMISPEMLAAALKIRFKGKTLDTALELIQNRL